MYPAAQRGTDVHDSIEQFMHGKVDQLHPEIHSKYGQMLTSLRAQYTHLGPEERWAVDENWEEVPYKSDKAWIRGFLDLGAQTKTVFDIYEWKTGRLYDSHVDQRFLYGTIGLTLWHEYSQVKVTGVYFDQKGIREGEVYERARLQWMQDEWKRRLARIEEEQRHDPNPTYLCRYCDFSKENGGPCQF
jgi:hypothetical protein